MPEAVAPAAQIDRTVIRLVKDDITELLVDAFVFYAQHDLQLGAGYGTAISARGGPAVQKELDELAPLKTCDVVASTAGDLKAELIIHAVGPRFQEEGIERKLGLTVQNCLALAEQRAVKTIAFPAMGAGYYGIPPDVCARVMLAEIGKHLRSETGIREVILCVLDSRQYASFEAALAALD
jgi:O-acetyl-ADP-ribose deacetylase (regulator of RNase III)